MTDQELVNILLARFINGADFQVWIVRNAYPAFRARHMYTLSQERETERAAARVHRAAQREQTRALREAEKLRRQGYVQTPDGQWWKRGPGQSDADVIRDWQHRQEQKARAVIFKPPY